MLSRLAIAFALLISGISLRTSFAQTTCPAVAPDSLTAAGQTLPLIRVGNTQIAPYPVATVTISPAGRGTVNVRAKPSAQAALVGSIPVGGTVTADGRNADGTWFHVQLADGGTGWASASVVKVDGDANTLSTRSGDDSTFPSGAGFALTASPDPNCPGSPNGVLLQTPDGTDSLILNVDGVALDLNKATVFITDDEQGLGIMVLQGSVQVESASSVTPLEAGVETHITRSADGRATGKPSDPTASDPRLIAQLPVAQLGQPVEAAPAATPDQTESANSGLSATSYQFAIDSSAPPTCISGELSADEVTQEGKTLIQNIPPWTTAVRFLQPGESIDVPVAGSGAKTVSAMAVDQVITLTVEDYGRKNLVAATQVSAGHYEDMHTAANGSRVGYRVEMISPTALKLTLVFTYRVTVTAGTSSSSRSCDDFEVYLTGTAQS